MCLPLLLIKITTFIVYHGHGGYIIKRIAAGEYGLFSLLAELLTMA